jgi:hypothetical protein
MIYNRIGDLISRTMVLILSFNSALLPADPPGTLVYRLLRCSGAVLVVSS